MYFLLFLVLLSAVGLKGLQVHDPSDPVVAEVGRAVFLPCTAQKSMSLEDLQVEWKKTDSDSVVITFEKGKSKPELQSKSFEGRVNIFPDEMSKGNFSILLQNVVKEDAGVYRCKVNTVQDSFETTVTIKTTDLLVVKGTNRITYDSVGDEVILNCSVNIPAQEIEEVTWKKKDGDLLVLLFQNNQTFSDSSHESYRERTEFFITEIPKGNFSLKLKDVRVEDKGEFICEVHTRHASGSTTVLLQSVEDLMVKGADQIIFASQGGDVMLNCYVDSHQAVHEVEQVTWTKKQGNLLVLLFQDNKTFSDPSHESYQGRAEFFMTEIPKGNFSLKLKDVRLEDKGEFICDIHTSNMSTRTIVDLQSVGLSVVHILILFLCIAALLVTVGFGFPAFNLLRKKVTTKTGLIKQATLMICPNICMFVAFILWSQEGFPFEVAICSAVCFARPLMLMKTSPYLINTLPDCLQKSVKTVAAPLYHVVIMMAACSVLYDDFQGGYKKHITYKLRIITTVSAPVVCFISALISAAFGLRMHSTLLFETVNGFLLAIFTYGTNTFLSLRIEMISVLPPLVIALMMVLFLQRHYFQGKPCKCIHIVLSSLFVVTYSLLDIGFYVIISLVPRDIATLWLILLEAVLYIIALLAVILLVRFHRERFPPQHRGKGYLCCTVIVSVPIILYGILCLHYIARIKRKDGARIMALMIFTHVLTPTSLFKHPKHVPELLHIMIYMFGAVGLTVINSITLAVALILKAGNILLYKA